MSTVYFYVGVGTVIQLGSLGRTASVGEDRGLDRRPRDMSSHARGHGKALEPGEGAVVVRCQVFTARGYRLGTISNGLRL